MDKREKAYKLRERRTERKEKNIGERKKTQGMEGRRRKGRREEKNGRKGKNKTGKKWLVHSRG